VSVGARLTAAAGGAWRWLLGCCALVLTQTCTVGLAGCVRGDADLLLDRIEAPGLYVGDAERCE
jgi:hypothetical protein